MKIDTEKMRKFSMEHLAVTGWKRALYIGIFVLLLWQLANIWGEWQDGACTIFYCIHAPMHEVGHTVANLCCLGETCTTMAGSVFQLLTPVAIGIYFAAKKDYRASLSLCLGWLGFAIIDMGGYMYDANLGRLQLVAPFQSVPDDAQGDFTVLFGMWGCLKQGCLIGKITAYIGYTCVYAALLMILLMLVLGIIKSLKSEEKHIAS